MEAAFAARQGLDYVNCDDPLHKAFFEHCGNRYFMDSYALVSSRIAALRNNFSTSHQPDQELSLTEHRRIIELFRENRMDELADLLKRHIGRARDYFLDAQENGLFTMQGSARQIYSFAPL
ncbi:FCD domain-containing protein [Pleomorphomonas koreensis]|uniref:FCD domain-containing protein n=1 Tax=Pleomorphomonas koreensis TaxID=257440 RepID=UPI000404CDA0|nr:FCD domain-containing protein [Pleomorphomonas koreensis]